MPLAANRLPAAVHAVADRQDRPNSSGTAVLARLGLCWMAHVVPSQCRASSRWTPNRFTDPTAVQADPDVHDTARGLKLRRADALGTGSSAHAPPFHDSASIDRGWALPMWPFPTAVHAVADRHQTPFSVKSFPFAGMGTGWIDHAVPFQRSTSGIVPPLVGVP